MVGDAAYCGMSRSRLAIPFLHALFFLSGAAALGYQMIWSRMFAAGLGHEMPSVLAVVGAFLGGMAVGSWALDGVLARSRRPGCWYGGLEILIGLWGLASTALIPITNQSALRYIGLDPSPLRHWGFAFSLPSLALLPATAAIGATFPAMERFLAPLTVNGRCVGALYAANTLGAVMGILMSTFVIAPGLGLRHCVWLLAGTNLLCGVVALVAGARLSSVQGGDATLEPVKVGGFSRRRLGVTIFCAGLFGIVFVTINVPVLS